MSLDNELKSLLLQTGLNESEVLVYTELLQSPCAKIWDLVLRTKLSKTSVYRAFSNLKTMKLVAEDGDLIKANSLKSLVAELNTEQRKLGKLADRIKSIAPFLRAPKEAIEEFDHLYTSDQIKEAYLFMSELDYDWNLDIGDFENFVPVLQDVDVTFKFRQNRFKHAKAHAVCSTFGPYTAMFCTKESQAKWCNIVDKTNIDFEKKFIVLSDKSDYVLFNDATDFKEPRSVLVKSKLIADFQRQQFRFLSREAGKIA